MGGFLFPQKARAAGYYLQLAQLRAKVLQAFIGGWFLCMDWNHKPTEDQPAED